MGYHYKNGQGDECFVHFGSGVCYTMFGARPSAKDPIIIPKGTIYHAGVQPAPDEKRRTRGEMPYGKFSSSETTNASHIAYPSAPLEADLEFLSAARARPASAQHRLTFDEIGEFEVRVKAGHDALVHLSYHPLDVVGWDGCYYPYIFNIDFSPITGKLHMPPPIHQTFEALLRDLLVLPRMLISAPRR